jgi:hypothetical protein
LINVDNRRGLGLFRHYRGLNKEPDCEMSILENTIIADIKDAERVGSGKHLADLTSEELEAKVNELEMILNTDKVDTYKAMGEYKSKGT